MRKTISLTILGLTLLAVATSSTSQTPVVYLIGLLVALCLYFTAVAFLFAVAGAAASPLLAVGALWLYRRRREGKPAPRWLKSLRQRAARRLPVVQRITASARAANHAWRQSASSQPAPSGEPATHTGDGCAGTAAS